MAKKKQSARACVLYPRFIESNRETIKQLRAVVLLTSIKIGVCVCASIKTVCLRPKDFQNPKKGWFLKFDANVNSWSRTECKMLPCRVSDQR